MVVLFVALSMLTISILSGIIYLIYKFIVDRHYRDEYRVVYLLSSISTILMGLITIHLNIKPNGDYSLGVMVGAWMIIIGTIFFALFSETFENIIDKLKRRK